jgi:ubiquinone/menaquinone biosynthesis C-methylase UbiE
MSEVQSEPGSRGNIFTAWHELRTAASDAEFLLAHLSPGMSLLDCGCGTGSITLGLAEALAPGQVIGVDLDRSRIESARAAAEKQSAANVRFDVGNVLSLNYEAACFDAVFASATLEHLQEPARALGEMHRVLKHGGVCGVSDTDHDGQFLTADDPSVLEFQQFFDDWNASRGSNYFIGKKLKALMRDAGFHLISVGAAHRVFSTPEEIGRWASRAKQAMEEPEARDFARLHLGDPDVVFPKWRAAWDAWSQNPDSLVVQVRIQVVGQKPDG